MTSDARGAPGSGPRPLLRRVDAVGIIVGIVVGAGIYKTPSLVASITGDAGWTIVAWLLGALISFVGALCYVELSTTYPHAGGDYHFLSRAYGRDVSFIYAWSRATVINPGSIALLAFVFGAYFTEVLPLGAHSSALWAGIVVFALTTLNIAGLRFSVRIQNLLTGVEIAGLVAIVVAGTLAPASPDALPTPFTASPGSGAFGLAMVFVLLTYGGWNEAATLSAELKGGRRAIANALWLSLAVIAASYVAVNLALLHGLGLDGLARSQAPAVDIVGRAFGAGGGAFAIKALGLSVAIATLTSINATMIVGARTNYAMGCDWPPLRVLSRWHGASGVPVAAYLVQATIALALVGFGSLQRDGFEAMVEFTAPVFWGFLSLVALAVPVMRRRDPRADRPFRVPLYPLTPVVFCAVCVYLAVSSLRYAASRDAVHISLLLMVFGIAAWALARTRSARV